MTIAQKRGNVQRGVALFFMLFIAGWRQLLKADLYYFIESDWLVKRYL